MDIFETQPYSEESERSIIGLCLMDYKQAIPACMEAGVDPTMFHSMGLGLAYQKCVEMFERGDVVDTASLLIELKKEKMDTAVGGPSGLAQILDSVFSVTSLPQHIRDLKDLSIRRRMMKIGYQMAVNASDQSTDLPELIDSCEKNVLDLDNDNSSNSLPSTKELVHRCISITEEAYKNNGNPVGLSTGVADLDRLITSGFQPGDLICLAGRPSTGKSSFAMQIALHQVLNQRNPVGVFSLEMSSELIMARCLAHVGKIDLKKIFDGQLGERGFKKYAKAGAILSGDGSILFVDDRAGVKIRDLRARARRMVSTMGVKMIVVDYLQLVLGSSPSMDNTARVSEVSRELKILGKQLKIPILALVQLNREIERGGPRKPKLSDIKDSGQIEQDADLVMTLWDPTPANEKHEEEAGCSKATISILKQRNGPLGDIPMVFIKKFMCHEMVALGSI